MSLHALVLVCPPHRKDDVVAALWDLATLGIAEQDLPAGLCRLTAWFPSRFEPTPFDGCETEWIEAPSEDWSTAWRMHWQPMKVGERLFLVPDWLDAEPPAGRLKLVIHPRQAAGTGYHPSTRLALAALETALRPGDTFLDVGAGSGILTAAARLFGAGSTYACDLDESAIAEARVHLPSARLWVGSPRSLAARSVDTVAANLTLDAILLLRGDLTRVVKPEGRLVLSGFRERHVPRLVQALSLDPVRRLDEDGWAALILHVPD